MCAPCSFCAFPQQVGGAKQQLRFLFRFLCGQHQLRFFFLIPRPAETGTGGGERIPFSQRLKGVLQDSVIYHLSSMTLLNAGYPCRRFRDTLFLLRSLAVFPSSAC